MKLILIIFLLGLAVPASATEFQAPVVPQSGEALMPERADSFGEGLWELIQDALSILQPEFMDACGSCLRVVAVVLLLSLLQTFSTSGKKTTALTGAVGICVILLESTNSLIQLGCSTIAELNQYGKLLLPVMTSALAAQGGITASAAMYTGTTVFNTVLCSLIDGLLVPIVYMLLAVSTAGSALEEPLLKKIANFLKWLCTWCLKTILYVFTGYMGITGVISGTTDAATLKAAKLTISGVVPVVGGILADASEAVLVSAGMVKNAAGLYGIFAILAVFLGPFLRIGVHYLLLKFTGAVSSVVAPKNCADLIGDYTSAMGLILAMTGSVCLLLLIGTVCFIKGVG